MKRAFADSSIILGFLDEDPQCKALYSTYEWVTSHAHLLEVSFILRQRQSLSDPETVLQRLIPLSIPIPDNAIQPAADIRLALRSQKKDCSYIDALGYGIARAHEMPLLIADDSFKGIPGVHHIHLRPGPRGRRARG